MSTSSPTLLAAGSVPQTAMLVLAPGDQVQIDFFGAPDLNTIQTIRRDGNLSLKLVGDVTAAGLTPAELQANLQDRYKSQLQIQSVSVVLVSASPVFVTGSVIRPGRVDMTRATTALEAIMLVGGFDHKWANVGKVTVIRHEGGTRTGYVLDFKPALAGKAGTEFFLKPYDIVYVPTRKF